MFLVPKRRWFRFSLRGLFALVTLVAVWLGWNVHQVRKRTGMLETTGVQSWTVRSPYSAVPSPSKRMPIAWALLGAREIVGINLPPDDFTEDDLRHYEVMFPEAEVSRLVPVNATLEVVEAPDDAN